MTVGYRDVVEDFDGGTLSVDSASKYIEKAIEDRGFSKVLTYPVNGIPEVEHKPARRPK